MSEAQERKPIAWRSLGVRWDHVEHFLIQYDDGKVEDYHQHISFHTPYGYLKDVPMDTALTRWTKLPPIELTSPAQAGKE